jgi:enoyl-[acyl-carrier-protein] reductase (NADH)
MLRNNLRLDFEGTHERENNPGSVGSEVALITRSSRAVGESIARTLAHACTSVVISSAHAASKAAMIQLARNFAVEFGPSNIRVNTIAPGLLKTNFSTAIWDTPAGRDFAARTPLKRLCEASDVAGAALFLASGLARFVTGQVLAVDGGALIADPF